MKISAFDFDGTVTTKDTLIEFIKYACGTDRFYRCFLLYSPLLILMKLHLYPNFKVKQKIFAHLFTGVKTETFDRLCTSFARENRQLLRPLAIDAINTALHDGETVVIVSASIDNWVRPFFTGKNILVIGTQIETRDGKVTGLFKTSNCYGPEKVRRIMEIFPDRGRYHLTAYGDSRGDKELLAWADESHYRPFRQTLPSVQNNRQQ